MKQIVIISGKGGTGKTTLAASFASIGNNKIICDCDVDAADLFLLLNPDTLKKENFTGQKIAFMNIKKCNQCGKCSQYCRFNAINNFKVNPLKCEGCGVCEFICPAQAISMNDSKDGKIINSKTKYGPFFYARLNPGSGNSGKLVTEIRKRALNLANKKKYDLIIIDGSPGIGCPVIASISGTDLALIVIEPTLSGEHDLKRIAALTRHFKVNTCVCINKYDINPRITEKIIKLCKKQNIPVAGKISYDPAITKSMINSKPVVEFIDNKTTKEIKNIWKQILRRIV